MELIVDEEILPALGELGLLEEGGLDALFARHTPGESGRAATAIVPVGDRAVVVRRLLHGGLLGPLLGPWFLGLGRPIRELEVTDSLHRSGAPVPRAAFALGVHRFGPLCHAALATWRVEDSRDALAFLADPDEGERVLEAAAVLGRTVRRFHDAGGRHGDLHVKNLLLREGEERLEGVVIDLDKARVTPGLNPDERMSQLMRLFRSLLKRELIDVVGARGCARFFGAYCGDDRHLRRALWARVDAEMRKVALHRWRY